MICVSHIVSPTAKTKHKRIGVLRSLMSYFDAVTALIGNADSCIIEARVEMKNSNELYEIAEQTQNTYLMHHVAICQMYVHCYSREHLSSVAWAEKYRMHAGTKGAKRVLDFFLCFFEGLCEHCFWLLLPTNCFHLTCSPSLFCHK